MVKTVHVVHCLDTEGPFCETLTATFDRIKAIHGVDLRPSQKTLADLQRKLIDLGGKEHAISTMVDREILDYNTTWDEIRKMLSTVTTQAYRNAEPDSFGGGWVFNWFCVDHVEYNENPRNRDIGYGKVFEKYLQMRSSGLTKQDGLHYHYHPMPFDRAAHHCGNHYFADTNTLFTSLCYRLIEHGWFPSCYRPGFNTIRPDSHWFLEQFIPFDFSNQSYDTPTDQPDLSDGRFGDWSRAPLSWSPFNPSHEDYQKPGSCNRYTARCLNVNTRFKLLNRTEVVRAFEEARNGKPVVMAFADHDYRKINNGINQVREFLNEVSVIYPDVNYKFSEARDAMRHALNLKKTNPIVFRAKVDNNRLSITSEKKTFGPQPYLAIATKDGRYFHDNFDIIEPARQWNYTFDEHTVPLSSISTLGFASNDSYGNTTVQRYKPDTEEFIVDTW
jgi:hypothetical protein